MQATSCARCCRRRRRSSACAITIPQCHLGDERKVASSSFMPTVAKWLTSTASQTLSALMIFAQFLSRSRHHHVSI